MSLIIFMNYTTNTQCRICKSSDLKLFLDLGDQPLANAFLTKENFVNEKKFPLEVYFCEKCNLAQLIHVVDKEVLFRNYIYFSSGMPKLSDHFQNYAQNIKDRFLRSEDLVVEIASNDGILLKSFQDSGYKVLGIDPATNVTQVAQERGIRTINDFFSVSVAHDIVKKFGKAKVIMANNVVAHIDDHHDLMQGISTLIDDDGVFVLEAPYLIDMFENVSYDTIYHEHLSLLAVRPLQVLCEQFHLQIFDVEIHPVQGFSIRVFISKKESSYPVSDHVKEFVEKELSLGLDTFASYQRLAEKVENSKKELLSLLHRLKSEGKSIAAYGAPAKGNTLLN